MRLQTRRYDAGCVSPSRLLYRENMTTEIRESFVPLRHNIRNSMRRLFSVSSVIVLLSACDNETCVLSPTSPSPAGPTSPAAPLLT